MALTDAISWPRMGIGVAPNWNIGGHPNLRILTYENNHCLGHACEPTKVPEQYFHGVIQRCSSTYRFLLATVRERFLDRCSAISFGLKVSQGRHVHQAQMNAGNPTGSIRAQHNPRRLNELLLLQRRSQFQTTGQPRYRRTHAICARSPSGIEHTSGFRGSACVSHSKWLRSTT